MYYYTARYYAPPTFISRDPMFEKYFWCSPYAYCMNNPVIYIDPTGKDGVVVVENKTVTIKVNIIFYAKGNKVGLADVEKSAENYKQNIMESWSKDANGNAWTTEHNGETYTVNFEVDVSVNNRMGIKGNRDYNGMNNYIGIGRSRSNVTNNHDGNWMVAHSSENAGAHEFAHLLGLNDRYTDVGNVSVPHKGWEGNIMGTYGGKLEQRNIDGIFNSVRQYRNETDGIKTPSGYIFILNAKNRER